MMETLCSIIDQLAFQRGSLCCIATVELPRRKRREGGIDCLEKVVEGTKRHTCTVGHSSIRR